MIQQSIFMEKGAPPGKADLANELGKLSANWNELVAYVNQHCPKAVEEWNYSKFGWNCRIKDTKRVILYLMPGKDEFRASVILGSKATENALAADIAEDTKTAIRQAKVYAEGRGIQVMVRSAGTAKDIRKLIDAKLTY